jgi:HEAT repeat protein
MHGRYLIAAALAAAALASAPLSPATAQARLASREAAFTPGAYLPAVRAQDPANTLYRQAREALNGDDFSRAARLFQQIRRQYPRSSYTPDALYWEAFSRYRLGGKDHLDYALGALETQRRDYPRAATRRDADELAARIRGELASRGDEKAGRDMTRQAERAGQPGCGDENDARMAALNGLLQVDADRALPIIQRVLARRDGCAKLREQAVFLLSQKRTAQTEETLLNVVRSDPDAGVREQAVFWLSQVGTDRSLEVIEELLRTSRDRGIQDKAVFALSQHRSPRAARLLRDYAERAGAPQEVREQAIFWLGQRASQENADYLRALYGRLNGQELREKVIFSLSQMRGFGNDRWIMGIAGDASQPVELRKQALFWASQQGMLPVSELAALYDRSRDAEMREQAIFALSQRGREAGAIDKLIDIARRDRDPEMRQKAIFWLGQSRDPRALRVIEDVIDQ